MHGGCTIWMTPRWVHGAGAFCGQPRCMDGMVLVWGGGAPMATCRG